MPYLIIRLAAPTDALDSLAPPRILALPDFCFDHLSGGPRGGGVGQLSAYINIYL